MATLYKITNFLLFIFFISTQSLAKQKPPKNRLILSLTHSSTSLPHPAKHHSTNSRTKLITNQLAQSMIEPVREVRDGYLISLNIGTPPQTIQVYMDTGSDLTWVPCGNLSFDCLNCDEYKNSKLMSAFSPSSSSTSYRDSCSSPFCIDIHSSDNPFDTCTISGCSLSTIIKGNCPRPCPSFSYTYGGGGVVSGTLNRDSIRVHENKGFITEISKFAFGCVGSTYHEPIGIVGFGRGKLSFPSQLGFDKKGFSHCFLGFKYSNNPNFSSSLIIGDVSSSSKDENFTPMLKSPIYPNYYYIGLEAITLISDDNNNNNTKISAITTQVQSNLREFDSFGNGGMLIDSGTTYTHLPEPLYSQLISTLRSSIDYPRAFEVEIKSGFDLCYKVSYNYGFIDEFPNIKFHFLNNVSIVLPQENSFYAMSAPSNSSVVKCLLFQNMELDGDNFGPAGVFGSFQQQNLKVVYDLENERIGFQAMDCALDGN